MVWKSTEIAEQGGTAIWHVDCLDQPVKDAGQRVNNRK